MTRYRPVLLCLLLAAVAAGSARAGSVCSTSCFQAPAGSGALLVFSGHGWGHGVGMSQYGAYGYAQHGATYDQILAHYYPGTTLGPAPARTIRVLLADRKKKLTIGATAPFTVVDGNRRKHTLAAGTSTYTPKLKWPAPLTFTPGRGSSLTLGKTYRGRILVDVVDGKLRAIDIVGLEQYLWGVVPSEMPASWAPEALKAQAVAARSYALATRAVGAPFDVYSDTRSQMYLGVTHESASTTAAVNATKGKVVLYDGAVAKTFFSSTSGGQTESSADWTGTALPYLVSVPDPYDALSPYHNWGPVPVTANAMLKALKLKGPLTDVTTTPNAAGRVGQLKLTTPLGPTSVAATQLRGAIGLRSTWFTVGLLSLTPPQPAAPVAYGGKVTLASVVRGFSGVTLEQRPAGTADWTPVRQLGSGQAQVTPTVTTDYRLATSTVAAGAVRIKVMPAVTLATATPTGVTGGAQPLLPGATVDLQQQNVDLTWTSIGSGVVAEDGTFTVPAALVTGATVRVVVTPPAGYAAATSASLVVSG
ncbi:MAG TPA: SpoIID/LytB domain-containing protein [Gaiellaceae bacterium]